MSLVRRPSRRFGTRSVGLLWRLPLIGRVRIPRNLAPLLLAVAVGLAAGFAAVVLTALVDGLVAVFDELASVLDNLAGGWTLMLVPAIAAIPVAFVVSRVSSESQGAGVPYVMVAVERAGGFVRPIIAPAKLVATGFTLGGGGAAGREGPIVLIAASLASTIGRLTRQPSDMLVLMVAAAAAGGIAATFNTPIAGTFFALEVVLRRFNVRNFTIVVVSAVVANIVAIAFYGSAHDLNLPELDLGSNWELFLHALVGVSAAIAGILFVRTRFFTEDVFEFLGVSMVVRPILGLFAVGVLALIEANILGPGLDQIRLFAEGGIATSTLAVLMVLKLIAASLTIGSGASGGAFAPLLFVGATLGALMGAGFESALPGVVGPTGTYVVVGMAAVFAAAARAPMTSLFIVFELSGYSLVLPLMTAVALATALAQLLTRDTIYNVRLRRAGLDVRDEHTPSPLDNLTVETTMRTDTPIVSRLATIQDLAAAMSQSRGNVVAVADNQNRFIGLVSATDVTSAVERAELGRRAFDLAAVAPIFVHPDDNLRYALSLLVDHRRTPIAGGRARGQHAPGGHADPARRAARSRTTQRSRAGSTRRSDTGPTPGRSGRDRVSGGTGISSRSHDRLAIGPARGVGDHGDPSARRDRHPARQCLARGQRPGRGTHGAARGGRGAVAVHQPKRSVADQLVVPAASAARADQPGRRRFDALSGCLHSGSCRASIRSRRLAARCPGLPQW